MAKKRVGKFPKVFWQMAVDRLTQCDNIVALAKEIGISRQLLYTWREQLEPLESSEGPRANSCEATLRKEVSRLKRVLTEKVLELDFSKGPCIPLRCDASGAAKLARRHLCPDPGCDVEARRVADRSSEFTCIAHLEACKCLSDVRYGTPMDGADYCLPSFLRTELKAKEPVFAAVPSWLQPGSPLLEPYRRSLWQRPTHVWSHLVPSCEWCNL